jgi:hypothetical protein
MMHSQSLLTDPMLQNPTLDLVHVVWFTEFAGEAYYANMEKRSRTKQSARQKSFPGCVKIWKMQIGGFLPEH